MERLGKLPILFFTTLFEPFTNQDARDFYKSQGQQIKEEGLLNYGAKQIKRTGQAVKDNPLEAILLGGGVALGWTDVGETTLIVPLAVGTVSGLKNGQSIVTLAKSIRTDGLGDKWLKLALYGSAVYMVASVPVSQALEFNSLTDAKAYYNGGPCPQNPWQSHMNPVVKCLEEGGTLQTCRPQIPSEVDSDLYIFTMHPSQDSNLAPVSITKLHDDQTCFYTALSGDTPVTKTCFFKLDDPTTRTVESVDMVLMKAHEGLEPGLSVQHFGLELQGDHYESKHCGYFHEIPTPYELGSKPICLLTALRSGGAVSQM